jgi:hypothetical protein
VKLEKICEMIHGNRNVCILPAIPMNKKIPGCLKHQAPCRSLCAYRYLARQLPDILKGLRPRSLYGIGVDKFRSMPLATPSCKIAISNRAGVLILPATVQIHVNGCIRGHLVELPAKFADLLVQSLRRDAFVMEAFNYQEPAVAQAPEFQAVFDLLFRQVAALYGDSASLVLAIDAHGCRKRNSAERERIIVTGFGMEGANCRAWRHTFAPATSAPPFLSKSLSYGDILKFCSAATPESSGIFEGLQCKTQKAIVSPYLVRPVSDSFTGMSFQEILKRWTEAYGISQLMHTQPYLDSIPERLSEFENAYFSAALCVFVPPELIHDETKRNYLEAIHLSFQISWGLPALEEQRRESGEFVQQQQELGRRYESFRQLRTKVHLISLEVQGRLHQLVRELDPGTGFDREDIAGLFDPPPSKEIWNGLDVTVTNIHDYKEQLKREIEALIYFAIHSSFGLSPDRTLTLSDLRSASGDLVERARCTITTRSFYNAILAGDQAAFRLLKAIAFPIRRDSRAISLYSFAVRLFLDTIAGDTLQVRIFHDGAYIALNARTFLEELTRERFLKNPRFPTKPGEKPAVWALPLSKLIGIELSGALPDQHVMVRSIDLVSVKNGDLCRVVCRLEQTDSESRINELKSILETEPQIHSSGLTEALMQLWKIRKTSSDWFNWVVTDDNELIFSIGRNE